MPEQINQPANQNNHAAVKVGTQIIGTSLTKISRAIPPPTAVTKAKEITPNRLSCKAIPICAPVMLNAAKPMASAIIKQRPNRCCDNVAPLSTSDSKRSKHNNQRIGLQNTCGIRPTKPSRIMPPPTAVSNAVMTTPSTSTACCSRPNSLKWQTQLSQ